MKRLTIDLHGPLHAVDYGGEGQLVLLVHGLGGSGINWVEIGQEMTKHGRVLAPDLPGFGRTPPAGRSSKIKPQADFLAELIASQTDQPAIVVGNSMGALVSMLLAAEHPQMVDKLILIDPPAPSMDVGVLNRLWLVTMLIYLVPGLNKALLAWMHRRGTPQGRTDAALAVLAGPGAQVSDSTRQLHAEVATERAHMPWIYRTYIKAFRSVMALLIRRRKFSRLVGEITSSTLLLHGTADTVVPFRASQRLANLRPDWKYVPLAGVGHIAMIESPRLFLSLASEFLDCDRAPAQGSTTGEQSFTLWAGGVRLF